MHAYLSVICVEGSGLFASGFFKNRICYNYLLSWVEDISNQVVSRE
jgi:hypothetical protein